MDGHLVWSEARGWADLRRRIVATPATGYRIYSVSKPITAVAAARAEIFAAHEEARHR